MALGAAEDVLLLRSLGPAAGLLQPALIGGLAGLYANNDKQAAIYSAVAGVAAPFLSSHAKTPGSIALAVVTSTAVGVVAQRLKQNFTGREQDRTQTTTYTITPKR
ncbi:MAG: hypothetical protein EBX37_07680 [Alphaproteobacteria bacterium]|nr:hypothetical protein [Alphaproteobacteria bacterium]